MTPLPFRLVAGAVGRQRPDRLAREPLGRLVLAKRVRRTAKATVVFLAVACASAPRNPVLDKYPAGVAGRTTILYYDVHGHTFDELRADMRRLGPKVDGSSFVGETRSPMRWNWRTEATGAGTCAIRDVTVSVNARNVKVITSKGKVTLRGPVNSDTEKETIDRIAREVAWDQNVDNQIEVTKPQE